LHHSLLTPVRPRPPSPDPCAAEPCNVNGSVCTGTKGDTPWQCVCMEGYISKIGEWGSGWPSTPQPPPPPACSGGSPSCAAPLNGLVPRPPAPRSASLLRAGRTCSECADGYWMKIGSPGIKDVTCGEPLCHSRASASLSGV
jgi:hypothetical protein